MNDTSTLNPQVTHYFPLVFRGKGRTLYLEKEPSGELVWKMAAHDDRGRSSIESAVVVEDKDAGLLIRRLMATPS